MEKRNKRVVCLFCVHFRMATKIPETKERDCKVIRNVVKPLTVACNSFKMVETFWCDKIMNRFDVVICINRQEKRLGRHCKPTCKQGMFIAACKQFEPDFIPLRRRGHERQVRQ